MEKLDRWTEQAEQKAIELAEQIKYYISEGINKETAIAMVRKETVLGDKYFSKAIELI